MNKLKMGLLITLSVFFLNGCSQGPAERKGKQIDNKLQEVKDKVQNIGTGQKLGEKIDKATGN